MTDAELDIHEASPDELVAAHTNVFDIWGQGRSLESHIRHRLNAPLSTRATWYVGCAGGRVVTSLGCYPLHFRIQGREVAGIAIGSVYTLSEFRGRRFAPRLLAWVEADQSKRGAALSVLYSDIEPNYYARLGYVLCPAMEGWRDPRENPAPAPEGYRLVRLDATEHRAALERLYADYHGAAPLSIARDESYWTAILKRFPDDVFYALQSSDGKWTAYARIGQRANDWRIIDFALAEQSDAAAERLYGALVALARASNVRRVGGWLPESDATRKFFTLSPRRSEITMIKPLAPATERAADLVASVGRFCEVDHV